MLNIVQNLREVISVRSPVDVKGWTGVWEGYEVRRTTFCCGTFHSRIGDRLRCTKSADRKKINKNPERRESFRISNPIPPRIKLKGFLICRTGGQGLDFTPQYHRGFPRGN